MIVHFVICINERNIQRLQALSCSLLYVMGHLSSKLVAKSSTTTFKAAREDGWHLYTSCIAWDQKEKSSGDKSGEFGCQ